jgi:hypothetical protein
VERWLADHEIDALLEGRSLVEDGNERVASVLAHLRDEFRRPVPADVAHRHVEAMLAAVPPAPVARTPRVRPRRVLALVACMGMTFAYGGLSAAGALPAAVDVPHHVHQWFGGAEHGDRAPAPTTGAVVDPPAQVGRFDPPALHDGANPSDEPRDDGAPHRDAAAAPTTVAPTPSTTAPDHGHEPGTAAAPATGNGNAHGDANDKANDNANGNANGRADAAPGQAIAPPGPSGATPADGASPPGSRIAPGRQDPSTPGNSGEHANAHATDSPAATKGGVDAH